MGRDEAYEGIKASLMRADTTGRGVLSKDILLKVLERVSDPPLASSSLSQFLDNLFEGDEIPILAFLDIIFQCFPGLGGADDVDLSTVFQLIDKNGNGFLEKEEVLAAANQADSKLMDLCNQIPALWSFLDVGKWENAFREMDTNQDGQISWFEFVSFFAKSGGGKAKSSKDQSDLVAVFKCIDTNGNGVLEKSEVLAAVNSQEPGLKDFCQQVPCMMPLLQPASWEAAFNALDTNADGMISWYEFVAFFESVCNPSDRV